MLAAGRGRVLRGGMQHLRVIAFDADDTLWHNESIFERVHERYRELLSQYHDAATVDRTLFATEMRNLELYGYGIKGFTLSAIETAIELTQGAISAGEIRTLLQLGRAMLDHPVELLDHVSPTLRQLAAQHELWLITKGDLRDQERKLAKSGLGPLFQVVRILSEKDADAYAAILREHTVKPQEFLMVGNSLKSDIVPVLELGGAGAHVPYHITWAAEHVEAVPPGQGRLFRLQNVREVEAVVRELAG
jgi:putative hydrolase of the HAD superfamily